MIKEPKKKKEELLLEIKVLREENETLKAYLVRDKNFTGHQNENAGSKLTESRMKSLLDILQHDSDTIQGFLDYALNEAIKLTDSKIGYIYHYSEEREEFVLNTWSKDVMKECSILEQRTLYQLEKTGIWGEAVRQRKPIMINNFQAEHTLKKGYPEGHAHLKSFLTVPIFSSNKIVGVVGVANKETDYTETDILQLSLLLDSVWKVVERKKAEDLLRDNNEKLDSLFKSMTEMVVLHELVFNEKGEADNYRILDCNDAFTEVTGISKEYAVGKLATDLYQSDEAPYIDLYSRVALSGQSDKITTYYAAMDKHFSISIVSPKKNQFATVTTDITNLTKIEAALRQSEEKFKNLVWDMQVGVLLQGPDAEIILSNPKALELLGISDEQIMGKTSFDPYWNVIHEDGSPFPGEDHPVPKAIASSRPVKNVVMGVFRPALKDYVWLLVDAEPQLNLDGTIRQVVCTFIDITQRINAQKKILNMNKELEDTNRTKDKFFSIISHDLRSPFQGFIGLTEIMVDQAKDFSEMELSKLSREMNESAKNLFKLLKNLLEWSQMQQGKISFSPGNHLLSKIVKHEVDSINQMALQKEIEIKSKIDDSLYIYADEKMVTSIFSNLISNAVKFTNRGGRVVISAKESDNNMVEISVSDDGIGMPEKLLGSLFKIEEKVGRRGTEGEETTGLGLLLCKEFVEKHGGKIRAESKAGEGSSFYFTIAKAL